MPENIEGAQITFPLQSNAVGGSLQTQGALTTVSNFCSRDRVNHTFPNIIFTYYGVYRVLLVLTGLKFLFHNNESYYGSWSTAGLNPSYN